MRLGDCERIWNCLQITAACWKLFFLCFKAFSYRNCSSYFPTVPIIILGEDIHDKRKDKPQREAVGMGNALGGSQQLSQFLCRNGVAYGEILTGGIRFKTAVRRRNPATDTKNIPIPSKVNRKSGFYIFFEASNPLGHKPVIFIGRMER